MNIVGWDPFRDFGFATANTWLPPVDIYQHGEHELVLTAELPDLSREDIDITVENFVLTLKGEKKLSSSRFPRRWMLPRCPPTTRTAC